MLMINNLTKTYGKSPALVGLNMHVEQGSIYAFLGENGAGKTTTLKIIVGLLREDSGEIILNGKNVKKMSRVERGKIGYMPDSFGVYDTLKVKEYMEFYASLYGINGRKGKETIAELLKLVNLSEYESQYVERLSIGMKQRLCLARTLVHDPEVLILDEPNNGLDPMGRQEMNDVLLSLKEQGKTVIISSHILPELSKISTHMGIIDHGKMKISGTMKEILSSREFHRPIAIEVIEGMDIGISLLKELKQVKNILIQENKLIVTFLGDEKDEADLLAMLIRNNVIIQSFKRNESDLEQVFLKLTQSNRNGGDI